VRASLKRPKSAVGLHARPPRDAALDERDRRRRVPLLGPDRPANGTDDDAAKGRRDYSTHAGAISRGLGRAATCAALAYLAACEDLQIPGTDVPGSDLIVLPQQTGTPEVPAATFFAVNSRTVSRSLRHTDNVATLFADLRFPAGSLASLDGATLGPNDSVRVTVTADPDTYGISVSPDGLVFTAGARPMLTLSYARYGDLQAGLASSRYPDVVSYAAALDMWREVGFDRWSVAAGSTNTGQDAVSASLSDGGRYIVAAPR
jgi:hypothetical protein